MIVGDPNQSIYGFNGATPEYMKNFFIEDFKATKELFWMKIIGVQKR